MKKMMMVASPMSPTRNPLTTKMTSLAASRDSGWRSTPASLAPLSEQREDQAHEDEPDGSQEVPVELAELDSQVLLARVAAEERAHVAHGEEKDPPHDVGRVEARQPVEDRGVAPRSDRDAREDEVAPRESLTAQEER